jgi:tRNA(His) 5'-end guanylyltransferase
MKNDDFGDRMKRYERETAFTAHHKLIKAEGDLLDYQEMEWRDDDMFMYMRLDGRSFSNFTKKLASRGLIMKPRDTAFESVFVRAVQDLVKEFSFKLAFHQSDEISLFFKPLLLDDEYSQLLFDGRLDKHISVIPSYFTSRFCYHFNEVYGEVPECSFDGRVAVFPSAAEATNMLVWRYQDASRNLIQDIAHFKFGDKALFKVSTQEKWEMIGSPDLRPGNFIKRVKYQLPLDTKGMVNVPQSVTRTRIDLLNIDFKTMTFDERVNLIYGEYNV